MKLHRLLLKSSRSIAILDTDDNTLRLKGKSFNLNPGLVIGVGDIITVQGEKFTVLPPDPVHFKDFSRRSAQIIQPWDAAAIIHYCSITPGKRVLESGCGSGALSLAILDAIGKQGTLTSVERDKSNIEIAVENVETVRNTDNWTLINSSIEQFSGTDRFDAVILDVPEPWNVIAKLSSNLGTGGKICCYSPTFNQLEKSNDALKKAGFYVLENFELLKRDFLVRPEATRPDNNIIGHTAFLTFGMKLSGSRTDKVEFS